MRWDSEAIVPNTSELLPEPETPVNTVSRRLGISMLTSRRLLTRDPCTAMRSWLSAVCPALMLPPLLAGASPSGDFEDADHIAGGITQRTIAHSVGLIGGLLNDLDIAGLQTLESSIEVLGCQVDAGIGAFGHHFGDRAFFLFGGAGRDRRRRQHDGGVRLPGRPDCQPMQPVVFDVVAHLESERVAVEAQGGFMIVMRKERVVNCQFHVAYATEFRLAALLYS